MVLSAHVYTLNQEELARAELTLAEIADLFGVSEDIVAEAAEFLSPEDDGQPSEAQEWYDFDPDC